MTTIEERGGKSLVRVVAAWLGTPDFARLWLGGTVSYFGTAVTAVALPLVALLTLHATTFEVGILSASGYISWLLFGLHAGVWVERHVRRPLLVACDLTRAAALVSVPVLAAFRMLTLVQLIVVALVVGIGTVFFDIASQTYLPSIVERDVLLSGNSKLQASVAVAQTAGPAMGGGIVQLVGAPAALLVNVASYLVSARCLLAITHRETPPAQAESRPVLRQIWDGLAFTVRDPVMRALLVVAASVNLLSAAFDTTLLIPFLVRTLHVPPGLVGVLLAVGGVGGVLGAAAGARFAAKLGFARALLAAALAVPIFSPLVPAAVPGAGLLLAAVGLLARDASVATLSLLIRTYRQVSAPPELLARVTATYRFLAWGVLPIGAFAGGLLGQGLGNRAALWTICGALVAAPLPIVFAWQRHGASGFEPLKQTQRT
jgi:MFS family permease